MTNSENKTVAVAVPVEFLTRILSNRFHPEEVEAFIPKPEPVFEMTAAMLEKELDQDQRVQAWQRIWERVHEVAPMAVDDNRTATDYVLSLLPGAPKPESRMVVVDLDAFNSIWMTQGSRPLEWLHSRPDLLGTLYAVINTASGDGIVKHPNTLKMRINQALDSIK